MDISESLRKEIARRGLSVTAVADGAELPFSTVSEFLRGTREIGADKASKIAEFLGFDLVISKLRRKEMESYEATIVAIEDRGFTVDDESVELAEQFLGNLTAIERAGYGDGWNEEDAELAEAFAVNLAAIERAGYDGGWDVEDAERAASFRADVEWLADNGWEAFSDEDTEAVAGFAANLKWLEEQGEEATTDRIEEVAQFVANLKKRKSGK